MRFLESYDDIQLVLQSFGDTLTFKNFSILGIPSFYTELIESGNYPIEQQAYNFQVSLKDCVDNLVKPDDKFIMSDDI